MLTAFFILAAVVVISALQSGPDAPELGHDTLPGAQRRLRKELSRIWPDKERVAALKNQIAFYERLIAEGDAHQAAWEAKHPGQSYVYFHSGE